MSDANGETECRKFNQRNLYEGTRHIRAGVGNGGCLVHPSAADGTRQKIKTVGATTGSERGHFAPGFGTEATPFFKSFAAPEAVLELGFSFTM